ncbi:MAG: hypothetical protein QQN41_07820 [Nitrosopumilus sp.]
MKKQYVQTTLQSFLSESRSITLKRGYGERKPVVVGAKAPLRNQILSFVSESKKVSKIELKKFIAGLNETSKNPVAAANMWIKRNAKFFVTENKNGITYFKLSTIGQRLTSRLIPTNISESEKRDFRNRLSRQIPPECKFEEDFDGSEFEEKAEPGSYDFVDRKKGYERPGIYDMEENFDEGKDELDEEQKKRIKKIIENIREKRDEKLNEEDDDELTFDDLDLDDEKEDKDDDEKEDKVKDDKDDDEKEDKVEDDDDEKVDKDDVDKVEDDDDKVEDEKVDNDDDKDDDEKVDKDDDDKVEGDEDKVEGDEDETNIEKVEITEFIITVENVADAIEELSELEVTAEQVVDEEGEEIEDQIKVSAEDWEALRGWLEEKGVDIEEMFGGEIEVEDVEDVEDVKDDDLDKGDKGDDIEDFDLEGGDDLGGGDEDNLEVDFVGGGGDEEEKFSLDDLEPKEDVEESSTGTENEEREKTPIIQGKEVTITIK